MLAWADEQAKRMKSRYRRGKRSNTEDEGGGRFPEGERKSKRQAHQGYEELHNLFSDTEVSNGNGGLDSLLELR